MELVSNDLATLRQSPWMGNSSRTSTQTILAVFIYSFLKAFIFKKIYLLSPISPQVKSEVTTFNLFKATINYNSKEQDSLKLFNITSLAIFPHFPQLSRSIKQIHRLINPFIKFLINKLCNIEQNYLVDIFNQNVLINIPRQWITK